MRSNVIITLCLSTGIFLSTLSGCTTNPTDGESVFTGLSSDRRELSLGRQHHPQFVKAFGGEFGSPKLRKYINSIGQLLAQTVERKKFKYTFTVLNSEIVNAFALPGGYIYISRGLLALAGNEAEIAGVLAHELGHINALHHSRRDGQGLLANILMAGVGIASGQHSTKRSQALDLARYITSGALSAYSREHELEADRLALRYMTRAGYDPKAMVSFLKKMRSWSRLQAKRLGQAPDKVDDFNYLATHPAPAERVRLARELSSKYRVRNPILEKKGYLQQIDGILFGSDPDQGLILGQVFAHPKLKFRFEVPKNFRLFNTRNAVFAKGPNGATIKFDSARKPSDGPITYYLQDVWWRNRQLRNVETLNINGLDAATGTIQIRGADIRAIVIRKNLQTIYRFIFKTKPDDTGGLARPFRRTTYSFRLLTGREVSNLKPLRIKVVRTKHGDTVSTLARVMAGRDGFSEERFKVINDLYGNTQVRPGQRVKIITH